MNIDTNLEPAAQTFVARMCCYAVDADIDMFVLRYVYT